MILPAAPAALLRGPRRRSHDELLADAQTGAQRLSVASRSWRSFPPGPAAIDEASNCVERLRQTLSELRAHSEEEAAGRNRK